MMSALSASRYIRNQIKKLVSAEKMENLTLNKTFLVYKAKYKANQKVLLEKMAK